MKRDDSARCVVAMDVGNTHADWGVLRGRRVLQRGRWPTRDVRAPQLRLCLDEAAAVHGASGVVCGAVVPHVERRVAQAARQAGLPFLAVRSTLRLGLRLSYPEPATLGADRLANAVGAAHRHGVPVVVVDVGTATTADAVHAERGFIGGFIVPGPALMLAYLAERTALLPRLAPGPAPRGALGRSTEEAMRLGTAIGYAGLTQALVEELLALPGMANAAVVLTGGGADALRRRVPRAWKRDRDLTLWGLYRMYGLNQPARGEARR